MTEEISTRGMKYSATEEYENIFTFPDQVLCVSGTTEMEKAHFTMFTTATQ